MTLVPRIANDHWQRLATVGDAVQHRPPASNAVYPSRLLAADVAPDAHQHGGKRHCARLAAMGVSRTFVMTYDTPGAIRGNTGELNKTTKKKEEAKGVQRKGEDGLRNDLNVLRDSTRAAASEGRLHLLRCRALCSSSGLVGAYLSELQVVCKKKTEPALCSLVI